MTPTHKDLVEALREAKEALKPFANAHAKGRPRYERVGSRHYDEMPGNWENNLQVTMEDGRRAETTLSKINPILNELEVE